MQLFRSKHHGAWRRADAGDLYGKAPRTGDDLSALCPRACEEIFGGRCAGGMCFSAYGNGLVVQGARKTFAVAQDDRGRAEQSEQAERAERAEQAERAERAEQAERAERAEQAEQAECRLLVRRGDGTIKGGKKYEPFFEGGAARG